MGKRPYIISLIVVFVFVWYYFIHLAFPVSLGFVNAVVAFSGTVLLGLSLLIGSLAKFVSFFNKFIDDRKTYGVFGYSLIAIHALLVILLLFGVQEETAIVPFVASLAFAVLAFGIFSIMGITSTKKWISLLGEKEWRRLQRTGYLALIFVIGHVALLDNGAFVTERISGQIVLSFLMLVVFLKLFSFVIFSSRNKRK